MVSMSKWCPDLLTNACLKIHHYVPTSIYPSFFTFIAVPILADEPGLRLLSLQHNLIKRIQHLDTTFRLVFLDLYHNRLDQIGGLEPLTNLRVLMLGKNRIRRIEGLQKCNRLSVLDLHGNRITQVLGCILFTISE